VEVVEEMSFRAGAGAPVARRPVREAARAAEAPARAAKLPARAVEATRGAAVATSAAATTPAKPPRKRKRDFSTLR
jgi:hypothetical protein